MSLVSALPGRAGKVRKSGWGSGELSKHDRAMLQIGGGKVKRQVEHDPL